MISETSVGEERNFFQTRRKYPGECKAASLHDFVSGNVSSVIIINVMVSNDFTGTTMNFVLFDKLYLHINISFSF